jgi:hypothetical protein
MFTAYFDESGTHTDSSILSLGVYISTNEQWREFEREWREVLDDAGITFFHMAKYESRHGEYKDWDNEKRVRVIKRLLGIIKRRVRIGIVSCLIYSAYDELIKSDPARLAFFGTPYAFNVHMCMKSISIWAERFSLSHFEPVAFVFENGAGYNGEIRRLFDRYVRVRHIKTNYRLDTLMFADKREIVQLQAADILAYEARKRAMNQLNESQRQFTRKSMSELFVHPNDYYYWNKEILADLLSYLENQRLESDGDTPSEILENPPL